MRLIDAKDFKQEIIKSLGIPCEGYLLESEKKIYYMIDKQPTIEAEPVRHGKWIERKDYPGLAYHCSECNYKIYGRPYQNTYVIFPYNYCPYCGAKMDGERRTDATD